MPIINFLGLGFQKIEHYKQTQTGREMQPNLLPYSVSQKSSPLKLFAIFSLRLSIFL